MKKSIIYLAALAALTLGACNKAKETTPAPEGYKTVTIQAGLEAVKTFYSPAGKFSWTEGDMIGVIYKKDDAYKQIAFTTHDNGSSATFTGSVPSGYVSTGIATYPFAGDHDDLIFDYEGSSRAEANSVYGAFRMYADSRISAGNPLYKLPLTGKMDADGFYQFKTAVGIVKFTVSNLPSTTGGMILESTSSAHYPLNGWFNLSDDGVLEQGNVASGWDNRDVYLTDDVEEGGTASFYFFLPVGVLPPGCEVHVINSSRQTLYSFTINKAVDIVRNTVVNVAPIAIPVDVESITLNKESITLNLFETTDLIATVLPEEASTRAIQWSVTPAGLVSFGEGTVTAMGVGTGVITATCGDKSATCEVTVAPQPGGPGEDLGDIIESDPWL